MRSLSSAVVLLAFCVGSAVHAQSPVVVLTDASDLAASVAQLPALRAAGLQVRVITSPGAFFGTRTPNLTGAAGRLEDLGLVIDSKYVSEYSSATLSVGDRLAVDYLAGLATGRFETEGTRNAMDWSGHPHDALDPATGEEITGEEEENRGGPGASPPQWTCANDHNSEYMEGTVCASMFFIESNGAVDPNTYSWTQPAIDDVKLQAIDAWSIWSYTASLNGITVTAVMDFYEPSGGIPVQGYEPVTRSSSQDYLWIEAIMQNAGRTESGAFAKCHAFNSSRRMALGTDRSYSAFIAYNPPAQSAPTQFTDGRIGYAYLGGPYTQFLYKANGWGTNQVNRVYGHETGHIFHAFDEYTASGSSNCTRSFNGRTNSNFQGSPCNGVAGCVMINNIFTGSGATRQWSLCSHTPYHLGWLGRLAAPTCTSPINDVVVTANPVVLRWNRNGAPIAASSFVKVFDRVSGSLVFCGSVGQRDTLALNLVNGLYRWVVAQGNTSTSTGYAGVIGAEGLFTVNAPLNASFTYTPNTLCAGSKVTFTNTSTGAPNSWTWSFSGGVPSTYTGVSPPQILYSAPGDYNVSLTVGDGTGSHTTNIVNAVSVTGGVPLPFSENFNGGVFPPNGWNSYGGEGGQGVPWATTPVSACDAQTTAFVSGYTFTGVSGPQLGTPRLDMTTATIPYLRFKYSYAQETAANTESLHIYGHDCSYEAYDDYFNLSGAALATNGGGFVAGQAWQPAQCEQWREVLVRADSLTGRIGQFWFQVVTQGGQNVFLDDVSVFNGIRVLVKALLQGPYDSGTELMSDGLRAQSLIPLAEPYAALGYVFTDEGVSRATTALALATTGNNALVDWMILEIRDASDPTRIRYSRPVLVQRDGDLVDYDGTSAPRVGVPAGNYHVCVKHRNHLGVMTAAPFALNTGMAPLDLSLTATPTWGTAARAISGTKSLLWSGNGTNDVDLRYTGIGNDRDPILIMVGSTTPNNTVSGYHLVDTNLDGSVRYTGASNDRDPILLNVGNTTPNSVRTQQVP
ncbi:MAG: PKD domain-containing protein [Flavobacteriales bacterium]|nr:PKD domain-containing protein [Flavobacteriales bacterium]